ncbi:MAG: hypothetical protein AB1813_28995, partial [Verrucomicrobiota bacterium]
LLIIACRTEALQHWIEENVLPRVPEFRERIAFTTFAELDCGHAAVFQVESWAPQEVLNSLNQKHKKP